ncbi:MAG: 23S rRNA (adenine(2030)-N(6))-methyltransferase RlmJ [Amaricoccus sp.]|uniref:23S rRNA (adenine(2030)-N(6))-methyltransferase RlmJ n=1 Tax=Amaricoccus sp. TaxID=1872485 RepID=UPI0039E70CA6
MLSYQHAYHAGGPADLHKHIVLAELLARLTATARAISYLETHAGRGIYDLGAAESLKTGEAAQGIARLDPDPATPFGRVMAEVRDEVGPTAYPGSPAVARVLLRPDDRITLLELHPGEHAGLRAALAGPGVAIHRRDGLEGGLALAPMTPRRGLVLVDPSYEVKSEYAAVAAFVRRLLAKWPEVAVLVWYPLLPAGRHAELLSGLHPLVPKVDEVAFDPEPARGMTGSGLVLLNAPHGAEAAFAAARAQAAPVLVPVNRRA